MFGKIETDIYVGSQKLFTMNLAFTCSLFGCCFDSSPNTRVLIDVGSTFALITSFSACVCVCVRLKWAAGEIIRT